MRTLPLFLFFFVCLCSLCGGQSITRQLVSPSSHSSGKTTTPKLKGSLGETFISSRKSGSVQLTEGFLQPAQIRLFILGETILCSGDSAQFNVIGQSDTYNWTTSENPTLTLDTTSSFNFLPEKDLWVYVSDGQRTDSVFIEFKDPSECPYELTVFEFITPNADNSNDFLFIQNIDISLSNTVHIYDQWGHLVFQEENYLNTWSPVELTPGVYVYIVDDRTGNRIYRGKLLIKSSTIE